MIRALLVLLLVSLMATASWADDNKKRALAEYRAGLTLYDQGEFERALDYFMRSYRLRPNAANTANAAWTLFKLRRYDEAYMRFEEVLRRFAGQLDATKRRALDQVFQQAKARVALLTVSSNVLGLVLIDGRSVGKLPFERPIAVLPGSRAVRVIKDGYGTYEKLLSLRSRQRVILDARLSPLAAAGELRIEDPAHPGSTVFVDRAPLGVSPWQGTVGPGEHVVWTRKGEVGSAPMRVIVVQGQAVTATARSGPLGPRTRIVVEPSSAQVSLDGVPLGSGTWEGRLPVGSYSVVASEAGYRSEARTVRVPASGDPVVASMRLGIEPDHPRWPKPLGGKLWVSTFGGGVLGRSLNGGPERNCSTCEDAPFAFGAIAGLRVGYRFPLGLSLELSGGYLHLRSEVERTIPSAAPDVRFDLVDDTQLHAGFVAVGASQRGKLFAAAFVHGRIAVGAAFLSAQIASGGVAVASRGAVPVVIDGSPDLASGPSLFIQTEVGISRRFAAVDLGVTLGLWAFATSGPEESERTTTVTHLCPPTAGCIATDEVIPNDRVHGPTLLLLPQLHASYDF